MRCPRCGELAPEGAAICDNCDEILDASFLGGDEITPVEGEKTDVGPAPTSPMPERLRKKRGKQAGLLPQSLAGRSLGERRVVAAAPDAGPPLALDQERGGDHRHRLGLAAALPLRRDPGDRLSALAKSRRRPRPPSAPRTGRGRRRRGHLHRVLLALGVEDARAARAGQDHRRHRRERAAGGRVSGPGLRRRRALRVDPGAERRLTATIPCGARRTPRAARPCSGPSSCAARRT